MRDAKIIAAMLAAALACAGCIDVLNDTNSTQTTHETTLSDGSVQVDVLENGQIVDTFIVPGPSNFDEQSPVGASNFDGDEGGQGNTATQGGGQ